MHACKISGKASSNFCCKVNLFTLKISFVYLTSATVKGVCKGPKELDKMGE